MQGLEPDRVIAETTVVGWTPAGDVFLALLFMIVVPLIFSALVMGMQELGQAKRFGRVGGYSLLMTVGLSLIACTIARTGPADRSGPPRRGWR